jgi:hypothetical protein
MRRVRSGRPMARAKLATNSDGAGKARYELGDSEPCGKFQWFLSVNFVESSLPIIISWRSLDGHMTWCVPYATQHLERPHTYASIAHPPKMSGCISHHIWKTRPTNIILTHYEWLVETHGALVWQIHKLKFDGLMLYFWWNIWKERNKRIFQRTSLGVAEVSQLTPGCTKMTVEPSRTPDNIYCLRWTSLVASTYMFFSCFCSFPFLPLFLVVARVASRPELVVVAPTIGFLFFCYCAFLTLFF